jgi:hypothetical protein
LPHAPNVTRRRSRLPAAGGIIVSRNEKIAEGVCRVRKLGTDGTVAVLFSATDSVYAEVQRGLQIMVPEIEIT